MMNKFFAFIFLVMFTFPAFSQAPQKFSFQAVIRNNSNNLILNAPVGIRIKILQGSATGTAVYTETHSVNTNNNGLVDLQIGGGTSVNGSISSINWNNGPYFISCETDPSGGNNYTIASTIQLLSVPYALFASEAANGLSNGTVTGQMMYWNGTSWMNLNPGTQAQVLTLCNGIPTWTSGGQCPTPAGSISSLNCAGATGTGTLTSSQPASGVSTTITYSGGNGGSYPAQSVSSSGVTGLNASLTAGNFSNGSGAITYNITGTPSGSGTASFAISLGGQTCSFTRTVSAGSPGSATCGATNVHNTSLTYGTVTDQDGNVYKSIIIGGREFMAENLKTAHYRNGDLIPAVSSQSAWLGLSTGAMCWYNNDSASFECPYGKLYNWYAVADTRGICPSGWHVPTDSEYTALGTALGGINIASGKLKTTGTQYWSPPNTDASNQSGFSALPAGERYLNGVYYDQGTFIYLWCSTEATTTDGWRRYFGNVFGDFIRGTADKNEGHSLRCIRD
ncbi:MAG: FISUMP domain-containing protein [Bacteroidota bacterium]